jgi:hypothetical protein
MNSNIHDSFQDDRVFCAKCGSTPEDILVLSCQHNLCKACTIKIIPPQSSDIQNTRAIPIIKCDICGKQTRVEEGTIDQLYKNTNESAINTPDCSKQDFSMYSSYENYCKTHSDEIAAYYCFDCNGCPLCSECAVHGEHKRHNVIMIAKANKILKDKINEKLTDLECEARSLEVYCIENEEKKLNLLKECTYAKEEICGVFKTIKELIARIECSVRQDIEAKYSTYENTIGNICDQLRFKHCNIEEKIHRYSELIANPHSYIDLWNEINAEPPIAIPDIMIAFPDIPTIDLNKNTANNIILQLQQLERNNALPDKSILSQSQRYLSPKFPQEDVSKQTDIYKTISLYNKFKSDSKYQQTARQLLRFKYL